MKIAIITDIHGNAERIDPSFIPYLEKTPRIIEEKIKQISVYFSHYYIKPEKRTVHISKDPFHSIILEPDLDHMEQLYKDVSAQLIGFGHHHPLHYFKGKNKTYLNPGALGCNEKSLAPYAIVDIKDDEFTIELKAAEYDRTNFIQTFETLKVPESDLILQAFFGIQ